MVKLKYGIKTTALLAAVVFLVISDRLFKALAISFKPDIKIVGDWFKIVLAKNSGIAFSLPLSGRWLEVAIVFVVIILIGLFVVKIKNAPYWQAVFYLAIIFGAASNLYDRAKYGYVIDYFSLKYYSVFNLADGLILFGVIGLVWLGIDKNK